MIKLFRLRGLQKLMLLLDVIIFFASYIIAGKMIVLDVLADPLRNAFVAFAPWFILLTVTTCYFFDMYDFSGRQQTSNKVFIMLLASIALIVELIFLKVAFDLIALPVSLVMIALTIQLLLTFGLRLLLNIVQSRLLGSRKVLFVANEAIADNDAFTTLLYSGQSRGKSWFAVHHTHALSNDSDRLPEYAWVDVDTLFISRHVSPESKKKLIGEAGMRNIEVLLIPDFYELSLLQSDVQQLDDIMMYSLLPPRLTLWERALKRTVDIAISLSILIVSSPIMLLLFMLIPLNSPGRAIFVQERIGRNEKPFKLLKFRSMIDNAEQHTGPVLANEHDTRITRLGRFIRATRMDELPQLINVLRGDMSFVGPRPEREHFISQFKAELPHYPYRLLVKPGITGLAQVKTKYTTTPADKLRFDLMYIKNYSVFLDIKIIFLTIAVVLRREQSRGVAAGPSAHSLDPMRSNNQAETVAVME